MKYRIGDLITNGRYIAVVVAISNQEVYMILPVQGKKVPYSRYNKFGYTDASFERFGYYAYQIGAK